MRWRPGSEVNTLSESAKFAAVCLWTSRDMKRLEPSKESLLEARITLEIGGGSL